MSLQVWLMLRQGLMGKTTGLALEDRGQCMYSADLVVLCSVGWLQIASFDQESPLMHLRKQQYIVGARLQILSPRSKTRVVTGNVTAQRD